MNVTARLVLAALLAYAASAHSAPTCQVGPQKKLYRLDLTVSAAFCKTEGSHDDPSCKTFPKESPIQLHGLWPNYTKGYPAGHCSPGECVEQSEDKGKYCGYPEPPGLYASEAWKQSSGYMAGTEKCLERHEWVKHGTCSPMSAPSYFAWALNATKHISSALDMPVDTLMSRNDLDTRIKARLPELNGAVRLNCKGNLVTGLYVLYTWGKEPGQPIKTSSGANSCGNCPQRFMIASK